MIFWILTGFMGESAEDGLRLCIEFCVLVSGCLFFALSLLVFLLPVLLQQAFRYMLVLEFELLDRIFVMNPALSRDSHHLFCNRFLELLHVEDIHEASAGYDVQIRFCVDKGCTISTLVLVVAQDVAVAEVATLHIHVEGSVEWQIDLAFQDVIHKLDFALEDEVDLISVIVLMEQVFATEEVHLLELGHELPEELRRLVREELDAFGDVHEHLLRYLSFDRHG